MRHAVPLEVPRLPAALAYLRWAAATHGVFFADHDKEVYATRMPEWVLDGLANVAGQIVSRKHASLIDAFVQQTPNEVLFVGYGRRVFDFIGLMRVLCELGHNRLRVSPAWAIGVRAHASTTRATQSKGPHDSLTTLDLGAHFEPWLLPDVLSQPEALHTIVVDSDAPWTRRRDAAVLLCNAPVETAEEARTTVMRLLNSIQRCESAPIVLEMWSRCVQIAQALLKGDDAWTNADYSEDIARIRVAASSIRRCYAE